MPEWLIRAGWVFYGIGLTGIGAQHFVFWGFYSGNGAEVASVDSGAADVRVCAWSGVDHGGVCDRFQHQGEKRCGGDRICVLILVVVEHIPAELAGYPKHLGSWTNAFKALTMCGGAWVVAGSLEEPGANFLRSAESLMRSGRYFLAITAATFGIDHFLYTDFVASLVPRWIPEPYFWTYFAAVALIASGVGMILNQQARLAALLLGIMIFLWLLMLHIPRAIADPHSGKGNEWTSVCEALAFSGIALLVAALPLSNRYSIAAAK
jgi:uncharacterized membrane protein YphA (DoxX/SURF4 family)